MSCPHPELEPGARCDCGYRKPHPRRADSPKSEVLSQRCPAGEKESTREVRHVAMQHAGINPESKYAEWKYAVALDAWALQQPPGFLARAMDGEA